MKNRDKIIAFTDEPVISTLLTSFLEESETNIRNISAKTGRKIRSVTAAANRGIPMKDISMAIKQAKDKSLHAAVGCKATSLRDISLQQHLKTYLQAA